MIPDFRIEANDKDVTERIRDRFIELRVVETSDRRSDYVELTLDDRDFKIADMVTGAWLSVYVGYAGQPLRLTGRFLHDETRYGLVPRQATFRARASDFRATAKAPRTRSWHQITLGDIVTTVAVEHGYRASVAPELSALLVSHVDQTAESDLSFLHRLARRYDATFKAANRALVFLPRGQGLSTKTREPLPVVTLRPEHVSRGYVRKNDRCRYGSVRAYWHDFASGETKEARIGGDSPVQDLPHVYRDEDTAKRSAMSALRRTKRRILQASIALPGDPQLMAEGRVKLEGFRPGVDGQWSVTSVTHLLNSRGYSCELEAEPVID